MGSGLSVKGPQDPAGGYLLRKLGADDPWMLERRGKITCNVGSVGAIKTNGNNVGSVGAIKTNVGSVGAIKTNVGSVGAIKTNGNAM